VVIKKNSVKFRETNLPGYELGSKGVELKESKVVAFGRIIEMMAIRELDCAKKARRVI
jgi:hypothetical protein